MGVIIDTSIWVDVERGRLAPGDVAALTGKEPVYLAPPVVAELEYGAYRATDAAQRNKRLVALDRIKSKPCLIVDKETGAIFGRLAADLDSAGKPAAHRVQDLWIAALALQHNLRILTQNARDFDGIPGLKVLAIPATHRPERTRAGG
jgi:predicted nucleic acid-binding protein